MAQNPDHDSRRLVVNLELVVPMRCACPSWNQSAAGAKYLLSYLVTWGDTIGDIAAKFDATKQAVLDANNLNTSDTIFPFTTILVPLKTEPTKLEVIPSPPPPPVAESPADGEGEGEGGSGKRPIIVGVGVGAAVLVLLSGFLAVWFVSHRRRRRRFYQEEEGGKSLSKSSPPPHQKMLDSLTVYAFEDLEKATGSFSEERRIKGSVYHAIINGDSAAVKRVKGDVSSEINILKQVNHSNVIRLSGFCHNEGSTYLVYEFAEKGSLADWIHSAAAQKELSAGDHLDWTRRVGIACEIADGLNYLHNCTSPPYIHKDLKSSNILLDGEFTAKVGNFGLARPAAEEDGASAQLTRHVMGTQGYMAPEYLDHGLVSPKLDVFAFGVVLLELLSGREAVYPDSAGEGKRDCLLSAAVAGVLSGEDVREKLKNFMDPRLQQEYPFSIAFAMAQLAMRCVAEDPNSRPNSGDLLVALSAIHRSSLDWDPSNLSHSGSISDDF
ncbi:unnamed protein product [Spirodela intermedia]|uniref:Uncharacterized protein n=1 Tax=Spirodela intermedia TaxID=51605 RepID=A0A7I8JJS2_SPIIN|nr:unnamed protein product [Spirodela intermedia]CAA6670416.1 unnamed protein product [Spirodela intermedia]